MSEQKMKEIMTPQKMKENIETIEQWLTKDGSKFFHSQDDNKYMKPKADGKKVPMHLVRGYSSQFITVYVDRHNKEVTIHTNPVRPGGGVDVLITSNMLMVKNPSIFFDFVKEKQLEFEKLFVNAQNNQNRKR